MLSINNFRSQRIGDLPGTNSYEHQLQELLQWVSEERNTRDFLQNLGTKLTVELESLKSAAQQQMHSNGSTPISNGLLLVELCVVLLKCDSL